ncbi:Sterol-4-alpha-carboxylate 3-dehydrogenase [Lachnellula suecica]|uniref:Sterol-4-alpha-carboxylate 3-dehydrogenase n=1 Tax=Lachnellula suecica TaxID=602035 RepID=A0A8T9C0G7_9HELO|nr:Sterol-4-alpha-carboxylate 3-dehydrogenase [Lachnellula suecica]
MGDLGSVFVIGGCGLLGHHIVKYLLESGDATSITVFDVSTINNRYNDSRVEYITGSITSRAGLLSALKNTNTKVIFNTASPDPLVPNPALLEEVNITGTQNVLECAMEFRIKVHVYTSSSEVVQNCYDDIVFANETWPLPESPVGGSVYARTKKIGEEFVLKANGQNGLLPTAIRLCTLFGEGDRVLTKHMVEMVQDGRAKYHVGSGKNLYDFIYAGNAAEGHILAAKKLLEASRAKEPIPEELGVDGEAFFMTNGNPIPFWSFSKLVASEMGMPIDDTDIWAQVRTFDIGKAKQRLEYQPSVDMREGIRRSVKWHVANNSKGEKSS